VAGWADNIHAMKLYQKIIPALIFAAVCIEAKGQEAQFKLQNTSASARENELIKLDRAFIEKKLGKLENGKFISLTGKDAAVPLQFDDLNLDGKWDEVVFLYAFKPAETADLKFKVTADKPLAGNVMAHVRQKRKNADDTFGADLLTDQVPAGQPNTDFTKATLPPYLTEGPAWENDKVGFRIYMDVRNTKDIWGKTTPKMMMDTVGVDPKVIYHHLAPWGMDILAVGKSLGAGSLALSVPRKGQTDTLVRLGGVNMGKISYQRIADGPVRAVFTMTYPEWNVLGDGRLASLTEEISIWGGKYFYESKATVKNAPKGAKLVTGIVNLKSHKSQEMSIDKVKGLYTFDKQSENGDELGMAVLLNQSDFSAFGQTPNDRTDVMNTYTVYMPVPSAGKRVSFRFYAAWAPTDKTFSAAEGFQRFLTAEAETYSNPIVIK
jgi:hypothetical protein